MGRARPLVLAIDIGGTKTALALTRDLPADGFVPVGQIATFPTPRDPTRLLELIGATVGRIVPHGEHVVAVGIGAPGPVDVQRGFIPSSPNIGWRDVPLAELVARELGGIPVVVEDDSNAGALGEAIAGAGRETDPYAYLPLGTGLGAGIILDGMILHGTGGSAGEVGHLAVGHRIGPRCSCGRRNCVEAWCAGAGLARRARETWPAARREDGTRAPRDAAAVFAYARAGDADAVALVELARHALATGIAAILAAVAPRAVTVGGSIGVSQRAFVRAAFGEATRLVDRSAGEAVELRAPQLGDASVLAGAAVLAVRASS